MALLEKELEVKLSTIPGSGKGLFTKTFIPKGTRIAEYKGRITTWKEVMHDWDNVYLYTVNQNHVIDGSNNKKMPARYANDAEGLTRIKGKRNNAHFLNDELRVFLVATRDINAGEEIFVSYGKDYWTTVKTNQKIDKKEKLKASQ